jgi:hypothetical protein
MKMLAFFSFAAVFLALGLWISVHGCSCVTGSRAELEGDKRKMAMRYNEDVKESIAPVVEDGDC